MAPRPDTTTGTITLTSGQTAFTTTGVQLLMRDHKPGDLIFNNGFVLIIGEITGENSGELLDPCPADAAGAAVPVRIRFQSDGSRVAAKTTNMVDLLGNGTIQSLADQDGSPGNLFPMFNGPNSFVLVPRTDLISGIDFDVQVADLAARAAYDGEATGFSVLVNNTGDGRAALYSKLSGASADWSAPAYYTGPAITLAVTSVEEIPYGEMPDVTLTPIGGGYNMGFQIPAGMYIEPGNVTTLAADQPASATFVPITGGYRLDFGIPRGPTGNIDGVTPFWVARLGSDVDAAAARIGLGIPDLITKTSAAIFGAKPSVADNADALNIAFASVKAAGNQLSLASGVYNFDATLIASSSMMLEGNGQKNSVLNLDANLGSSGSALLVSMVAGQGQHYNGLRFRDFGITATSAANAGIGLHVYLAAGAYLANFEFHSLNIGEFSSWGMMLDNSIDNLDGFFVGSVYRCSITNGFYAPNLGDSFNFELSQCHAGVGAGGGNPACFIEGVPGARQYIVRANNFTCRGGAFIGLNADQLRLENNQCEHSWWTGDGAYTNPQGHNAHVTVKDSLQPLITGNTMNSFPSLVRPVVSTSGRYDIGSPTITQMNSADVAAIQVGHEVYSPDGLLPGGLTYTVLSKTATSITINANATSTAVASVVVTRLINPNGAASTLKIDGCNEALIENNDIAMGRLQHIEITATSKNTRIGPNRYYGSLSPVILDNGQGTMGVWKTPTLLNSWVNASATEGIRFIKDVNGRVTVAGAVKSGVIGQSAFVLPVGFRPITGVSFPVLSIDFGGTGQISAYASIAADGIVMLIGGDNDYFGLSSISFMAGLVA